MEARPGTPAGAARRRGRRPAAPRRAATAPGPPRRGPRRGSRRAAGTPSASNASVKAGSRAAAIDAHRAERRRPATTGRGPASAEVGLGRGREHQAHRRLGAAAARARPAWENTELTTLHGPGSSARTPGRAAACAHESSSSGFIQALPQSPATSERAGLGRRGDQAGALDPAHLRAVAGVGQAGDRARRPSGRAERHQGAVGREGDRPGVRDRRGPAGERLGASPAPRR